MKDSLNQIDVGEVRDGGVEMEIGFEEISKLEEILFRKNFSLKDFDKLYDFFQLNYYEESYDIEDFVDLKDYIDSVYSNELKKKIDFLSTALAYMISADGKKFTRK